MKISAIIPNFNDDRVHRALNHLFAQDYPMKQIVVVDGGSRVERVHEIYRKFPIDTLIVEKDDGIFDALNKGVAASDGEVIFLQGADDYLPDASTFSVAAAALQQNPGLDGVCIGCQFVNAREKVIRIWRLDRVSSLRIFLGIYPPHFSLFLRRRIYEAVGPFKVAETKNVATDSLWLIDMARTCHPLRIPILRDYHLRMEYGGASTGSLDAILRQFFVVQRYARKVRIPFWSTHATVKVLSKLFQFPLRRVR